MEALDIQRPTLSKHPCSARAGHLNQVKLSADLFKQPILRRSLAVVDGSEIQLYNQLTS